MPPTLTPDAHSSAERELLARLGLTAKASDDDVETAHADLVEFLGKAPTGLRTWAGRELASIDEAYALLSDPAADPAALAGDTSPPARSRLARDGIHLSSRFVLGFAAVAVAAVVGIVVYQSGKPSTASAEPAPATTTTADTAASQLDTAKVAQLMQRISANPNDVTSLTALGDLYFQAGDYNTAGGWMAKAVAISPKDVKARLALGAAQFNLGNTTAAEKQWKRVVALDPKNVEAYYDLGFLYLSEKPVDTARAKAAWAKVVAIAPKSNVAKTVATHLKTLGGSADKAAGRNATGK